eukprot:jgi/Bigna1/141668/aug1.64_g16376
MDDSKSRADDDFHALLRIGVVFAPSVLTLCSAHPGKGENPTYRSAWRLDAVSLCLDNKNWVGELPSVTEHLRLKIKNRPQHCRGWRVTNHSIDGYMINGVIRTQLPRVTKEMTHLVISVGGNNALGYLGEFITAGFWNPWGVLSTFRKVLSAFERDYARMVDAVLERIGDGDEKEVGAMCGLVLIDSKGFIAALVNRCATAFNTMLMRLIVGKC